MARITVEEISRKEFSFANKGYNQKEVDDFLDDICDEIERMENEIMDLRQKTTVVRNETPNSTVSAETSAPRLWHHSCKHPLCRRRRRARPLDHALQRGHRQ